MKTEKILQTPIAKKLYNLKLEHTSNVLYGQVKEAKECHRNFAKLAVENFDTFIKTPSPIKGSFSIFSKPGFNIIKYLIYSFFTKDSPDEKKL